MKTSQYIVYICIILLIVLIVYPLFYPIKEGFDDSIRGSLSKSGSSILLSDDSSSTQNLSNTLSDAKNLHSEVTEYMGLVSGILENTQNKAYQSAMYYQYVSKKIHLPSKIQQKYDQVIFTIADISNNYKSIQQSNGSITKVYNDLVDMSSSIQMKTSTYQDASFAYYTSVKTYQSLQNNKSVNAPDVEVAKTDMMQKKTKMDAIQTEIDSLSMKYNESNSANGNDLTSQMASMKSKFAIIKKSIGGLDHLLSELNTLTGYTSGKMIMDNDCMNAG